MAALGVTLRNNENCRASAREARQFIQDRTGDLSERVPLTQRVAIAALEEFFTSGGLIAPFENFLEQTHWDRDFDTQYIIPNPSPEFEAEADEAERDLDEMRKQAIDQAYAEADAPATPPGKQDDAMKRHGQAKWELRAAKQGWHDYCDEDGAIAAGRANASDGDDAEQPSGTTSVRDYEDVLKGRQLTRDMTDAEGASRQAKKDAVEAGIDCVSAGQSSVFGKEIEVRYGSGEQVGDRIERWIEGVERAEDAGCHSPHSFQSGPVADDWDAQSVAVGEGASVVAEHRPGQRIDEWRNARSLLHACRRS